MYVDAQNLFSDAQAFSGTGAVGTNVIDLISDRSIGSGEPMAVVFKVDVAADQTTGDEDYTFDLEYASDSAQTTARKLVGRIVFESGTPDAPALDADLLVAGFQFAIAMPPAGLSQTEQFLGIRAVLAGTTPTITVTAFLQPMSMIDADVRYPVGFSIT